MFVLTKIIRFLMLWSVTTLLYAQAETVDFSRLKMAYPDFVSKISSDKIIFKDGTALPLYEGHPSLADQMKADYPEDKISPAMIMKLKVDPGRDRYLPFFEKMYGATRDEVIQKLVTIYWMPNVFGKKYPLRVSKVNGVDKKLMQISAELEKLPISYYPFLMDPEGTFDWRTIAHKDCLSMHSFGVAFDLNTARTNYWQWDLAQERLPISESTSLIYRNRIPWAIVAIFEKYGFIWGGKWYHYDTMHFEYRPELFKQKV